MDNILGNRYPHLVKEWHMKNEFSPFEITYGSQKKVYWICDKEHEWEATISSRSQGKGCPKCSGRVATDQNNLYVKRPDLAAQWHPTKNNGLSPKDVTSSSHKRVWWLCENGHEWDQTIMARNRLNCPMCAGKRASKENNLKTRFPYISKDWHPFKNGDLSPTDVLPNQPREIWWLCEIGHEVKESLMDRTNSKGCRLCNLMMLASFPEKALAFYIEKFTPVHCQKLISNTKHMVDIFLPELNIVLEYDGEYFHENKVEFDTQKTTDIVEQNINVIRIRIGKLPPIQGAKNLHYKEEELDEAIHAVLFYLAENFNLPTHSVPINSNKETYLILDRYTKIYLEDSLAKTHVCLTNEWHPTKNSPLTPEKVKAHQSINIWWRCKEGHEWQARIRSRTSGSNCKTCAGQLPTKDYNLAVLFPKLSREWHPFLNDNLTPDNILPFSSKSVWWLCEKGHSFENRVYSRSKSNIKCPVCSNYKITEANSLASLYPDPAKWWHLEKNSSLTPNDVSPKSKKKVWWYCGVGHSFELEVHKKVKGGRCPYCSGRFASEDNNLSVTHPGLAEQWNEMKNNPLNIKSVTSRSKKKVWWICKKGHEWQATISNRVKGTGCPDCTNKRVNKENNLLTVNPLLAKQWHPSKNELLTPNDVLPNSHKYAWWICECGHEWQAIIKNRNKGNNCPMCKAKEASKRMKLFHQKKINYFNNKQSNNKLYLTK